MKKSVRIVIGVGCCMLLIISWLVVLNSKSAAEKQLVFINQAVAYMDDGIFIRAIPLLEEAAELNSVHTITAENELKKAYLALIDNSGFSRKYISLLEKQMDRRNAQPDVFVEAANYYFNNSKIPDALTVLKDGIEKIGDSGLVALYENSRYAFSMGRTAYENIAAIYNQTAQVQIDGKWGIANPGGNMIIPCQYDHISTFSEDRVIVKKADSIYAVDRDNNRIAVTYENILDFGNYGHNRISLFIDGSWRRSSGDFEIGTAVFEEIGMYSYGYVAAKTDGKWGVIDSMMQWLISPQYDGVIQDELGRCYAQGAVFVRLGNDVKLIINGEYIGDIYEDARPFGDEGYAAVKKNGKWGFIDTKGVEVLPFVFDDALSFGQHLAAVKQGELWGYISIYGNMVIDAVFHDAKSFSGGSAPVLTQQGWQFITLVEFKRGISL
ncbi:MAG: WG repeat-containing protein [Oscillospiraceae bacterium]|jgi:tetratricopeptide (TPR) repeat protein|nr:WG repeat-containing protein [Oscillospiraceae bacterium]